VVDARWEWVLVVDQALTAEDLQRVVDSIPLDEDDLA
jgi:hypothetical protein